MFRKIVRSDSRKKANYLVHNEVKKLLLISLVLLQTTTHAAWEKLLRIDSTTVYVDMSKGQSTSDIVTIAALRDCGEQREFMGSMYGFSFRSSQFITEYKCSTREQRHLQSIWFADEMGNGKVSFKKLYPQDWVGVGDDAIDKALFEYFCLAK